MRCSSVVLASYVCRGCWRRWEARSRHDEARELLKGAVREAETLCCCGRAQGGVYGWVDLLSQTVKSSKLCWKMYEESREQQEVKAESKGRLRLQQAHPGKDHGGTAQQRAIGTRHSRPRSTESRSKWCGSTRAKAESFDWATSNLVEFGAISLNAPEGRDLISYSTASNIVGVRFAILKSDQRRLIRQ